jgi:hypothetical protein
MPRKLAKIGLTKNQVSSLRILLTSGENHVVLPSSTPSPVDLAMPWAANLPGRSTGFVVGRVVGHSRRPIPSATPVRFRAPHSHFAGVSMAEHAGGVFLYALGGD